MQGKALLTDEELVEHTRIQNQESYRTLVERYEVKLMRYAVYLLKNEAEAADVVQEAFVKAFVNLNGFDVKKKFSSWIYRIVHNEAMNNIAKRKKQVSLEENEWVEQVVSEDESLEETFDKKETERILAACLSELPVKYKEALALFYMEEKSYEEISDILRIPIGTVGTNINRGRKLAKAIFEIKRRKSQW